MWLSFGGAANHPALGRLLGSGRRPRLLAVNRYADGIPVYGRRHAQRIRVLRRRLWEVDGPHLAGMAYDGVSFGAALASGRAAARRILDA